MTAQPATDQLAEQLQPVRDALLADARSEAGELLSAARNAADALVAEAESAAEAEVAKATHRNEQAAAASLEHELARAKNDARRAILRAQAQIQHDLVDDVRVAALALRNEPRYPALLDRLEDMARIQLGESVEIERDPPGEGGVRGTAGNRRVDYTLGALADRAVGALAEEVAQLWV